MQAYIILIFIFFIPPLITGIEFLIFIGTGKRPLGGPIAFTLDILSTVFFPFLYIVSESNYYNNGGIFLDPPLYYLTLCVIGLCVISYFFTTYFPNILTHRLKVAALITLAFGIFLNMGLIYQQDAIFSIFNIAIILLFIMRISQTTENMLTEKEDELKQRLKDSLTEKL